MSFERQPGAGEATDSDGGTDDSNRTPLDWPRHTGRLGQVMDAIAVRKKRRQRRRVSAAVAAAAGLAALWVAGLFWFSPAAGPRGDGAIGWTSPNAPIVSLPERRMLPDGSIVELKDGSEIAVDFGGALRRVALRHGNAHFQVAANPERPFVVEAGGVEFRAVGTAFAVQLSGTHVEMLVTEGRVTVERASGKSANVDALSSADAPSSVDAGAIPAPPPGRLDLVTAGNQVVVSLTKAAADDAAPRITPLSPAESGEKLAWRVPRMELSDTPLAEAIAAINRHSPVPLEIVDVELGKVGISGVLRADNIEPLLRMLENNYDIRADRREAGKIILRQRK